MKYGSYDHFKKTVTDKDHAVDYFVSYYLDKTQSMFRYENLPETIPEQELERLLQTHGQCVIAKVGDDLYALSGNPSGEPDAYDRPRFYIVTNPYLNLSKEYELGKDAILFKNDYEMRGLLPLIGRYATLLTDSELTLNVATILSRITLMISASDDNTKKSAEQFVEKIMKGELSVIGSTPLFEGVKLHTPTTTNSIYITQLVELIQYYKATFLNELGLNANYNMKRERLTADEASLNIDVLLPFVDNMMEERKLAVDNINNMFDTDIIVDFSSAWKTTHEESEQATERAMVSVTTENGAETLLPESSQLDLDETHNEGDDPVNEVLAQDEESDSELSDSEDREETKETKTIEEESDGDESQQEESNNESEESQENSENHTKEDETNEGGDGKETVEEDETEEDKKKKDETE